jgi:hypothetical protein
MALEIGQLLECSRNAIQNGEWGDFTSACGMSRVTAWRYMQVAKDWDAKANRLARGLSLCDVYREIGLLPPCEGGGQRLGKVELQRRHALEQMVFHFDLWETGLKEFSRFTENPLLARLDELDTERLQTDCNAAERAAQFYREALEAKRRTIPVESTSQL